MPLESLKQPFPQPSLVSTMRLAERDVEQGQRWEPASNGFGLHVTKSPIFLQCCEDTTLCSSRYVVSNRKGNNESYVCPWLRGHPTTSLVLVPAMSTEKPSVLLSPSNLSCPSKITPLFTMSADSVCQVHLGISRGRSHSSPGFLAQKRMALTTMPHGCTRVAGP